MAKRNTSKALLPPHDEDLEQAILGAILIDKDSLLKIYKDFRPDIFYKESHQLIAESILKLHNEARKVDLLTILNDLKSIGKIDIVGGAYFLTELTDRVVSSYHIEEHFDIVKSHYVAREQIKLYQEKVSDLYSLQDPYDIANSVSSSLVLLQEDSYTDSEYTMQQLATDSLRRRESQGTEKIEFTGFSSGIKALDKVLNGIKEPDLTIIAGRPGQGKTIVALNVAKALAKQGPVSIFSLEMSASQLYDRMLSNESEIKNSKIKRNELSNTEREYLSAADQHLSSEKIVINDTPALNIDKFRSLAMIHVRKYGTQAIVIDYLGLMKGNTKGFGNNTSEVTEITGKLKRVAKELKIPIIALAQLSRAVESRKEDMYRPKLSDLRDSGSIEQDADNVIFLWRPSYYGLDKPVYIREYDRDFLTENLLMMIVAKCRDGETKSIPTYVDLSLMTIKDHPDIDYILNPVQTEFPF